MKILPKNIAVLLEVARMLSKEKSNAYQVSRAMKIAETIKCSGYDIVCLQEVFDEDVRQILIQVLSPEDPYMCATANSAVFLPREASSLERETADPSLQFVWYAPMEALRTADKWVIAGYSLPPEDINIRSMLIRAYNNRDTNEKPKVMVVQIDNEAKAKYTEMFPKCDYLALPEGFIGYCKSH